MRFIRYTFLTAFMIGASVVAASAQKDGDKRPPKEKPPVVTPAEPKKPPPTPKPGMAFTDARTNEEFI